VLVSWQLGPPCCCTGRRRLTPGWCLTLGLDWCGMRSTYKPHGTVASVLVLLLLDMVRRRWPGRVCVGGGGG
jgi:hypothetical protein